MLKKNLLIHPGFQIDTWSSIEQRYIWLDKPLREYFNVFWLVPPTGSKYSRHTNKKDKDKEEKDKADKEDKERKARDKADKEEKDCCFMLK